ncbi:MAG: hypothetical protein MMC23_003118 [Stictis urceolatum]|nr:hypothetical protein [Stictis urceolata]
MIASSPSPTLHSTSPHHASHAHFARSRPSPSPSSPSTFSRPTHQASSSRAASSLQARNSSSSLRATRDIGTQYSPPAETTSKSSASSSSPESPRKRKERPVSPEHAPNEPEIQPQMPAKRSEVQPQHTATPGNLSGSASSTASTESSSSKRPRPEAESMKVMPIQYEHCDVKDLVQLIAAMLMELIRHNDEIPLQDGRLTRFHSRAPPGISVADYLQRLTTHATLSPPILLSMVYYIDRLCLLYPQFTISSLTVHRYLIASATAASKGLSDSFWTNNTYARVGGVSLKELALLELEFLWRLDWKIVPKPETLVDYYRSLVDRNDGFEIEGSDQMSETGAPS